jgi:hypothetical protein
VGPFGIQKQMDLKKLRPTYSQWRAPLGPVSGDRKPVAPTPSSKKTLEPPKGKGGELWTRFYNDAVAKGHPQPEKLADTLLRSRELALKLAAERPKLLVTDHKPKAVETATQAGPAAARKGRAVVSDAHRCKALTLEGRRCGFKATCGDFCKKHNTSEKI